MRRLITLFAVCALCFVAQSGEAQKPQPVTAKEVVDLLQRMPQTKERDAIISRLTGNTGPITGPDEIQIGDFVELRANVEPNTKCAWLAIPEPRQMRVFEDGKTLIMSSGNKARSGSVVLAVGAEDGPKIFKHDYAIVGSVDPTPDPTPNPTPDPVPDGLQAFIVKAVQDKAPDATKAEAIHLADNAEAIATKISVGMYGSKSAALDELRELNKATLGTRVGAWKGFFAALGTELNRLEDSGEIASVNTLQAILVDVSKGLRAASKVLSSSVISIRVNGEPSDLQLLQNAPVPSGVETQGCETGNCPVSQPARVNTKTYNQYRWFRRR